MALTARSEEAIDASGNNVQASLQTATMWHLRIPHPQKRSEITPQGLQRDGSIGRSFGA